MKKILSLIAIMLGALVGYSQAPGILNYQGVARNSVGNVLVNKTINLRLTIRDGAAAGPTVYQESRIVTTNPFGLFNVQVGSPGATSVTGTIPGVNWAVGAKFIQVEIDPNGGTSFINIGTAQLASVPYSLYSNLSGDLVLPFNKTQADAGTLFKITNSNTTSAGATALEGLTNSTAGNANAIIGTVTSASPGGFSAGVRGINNGTGGLGIGVHGSQAGSGWGVYGFTPGGIGVNGASNTGTGLWGSSSSGTGVFGTSSTGSAGVFSNTNSSNSATTVSISTSSTSAPALTVRGPDIWGSAIAINNSVSGMEWRMNVQGNRFNITKVPGTTFTPFQLFDDGQVEFPNTSGGQRVRILNNGDVGIGTAGPFARLTVVQNNSGVNLGGGANTGSEIKFLGFGTSHISIYNRGNNALTFANTSALAQTDVLGSPLMTLTTAGRLGIGTTTPARNLHVVGNVNITDGTQALNRVLTSDAAGNASWQDPSGIGVVTGSGTLNFVPKWTPNGTNLGNSLLFDNGSSIGISTTNPLRKLDIVQTGGNYSGVNIVHSLVPSLNLTATGGGREIISFGEPVASPGGTPINAQIGFFKTGAGIHQNNLVFATDNFGDRPDITISKTNNGNVGIGRSDATAKLEIFTNSVVGTPQLLINENDNDFARINLMTTNAVNAGNNFWAVAGYNNDTRDNERLNFYNNATGNLMSIGGTGKVGLDNTGFSSAKFTVFSNDGTRGFPAIRIQNTFSGQGNFDGIYMGYNLTSTGNAYNVNQENGDYTIGTNNDLTQLVLKNNGYIGAGTASPVGRFQVDGAGTSTTVTPTWINYAPNSYFWNTTPSTDNKVGGLGFAEGSTGGWNEGLTGIAGGSSPIGNVGVVGLAGEASAASNYGMFAQVANSAANNIGIISIAPLGVNSWSGYFSGRVAIVDGTQANGRVLTSDASGNASWQDPSATRIAFSARGLTSPVSIPFFTFTPISQWAVIDYEEGSVGNYNPLTGEYTVPKTGKYHISSEMVFNSPAATGNGYAGLTVFVNGNPVKTGYNSMSSTTVANGVHVNVDFELNAGDLVQIQIFHNTSGSATLNNGLTWSNSWSIHLIK